MRFNKILLPLVLSLVLALGIILGLKLRNDKSEGETFNNSNKIESLIQLIENKYVDEIKNKEIEEEAIKSMLQNLDPHSSYLEPKKLVYAEEDLSGHFYGIGVQFRRYKDTVIVIMPVEGGPSEKAGIITGDRLIKANNKALTGDSIDNDRVMGLLKGEYGTDVELKVKRPGVKSLKVFNIKRGNIPVYSVDVSLKSNKDIGYIKLSKFSATTYDEFIEHVDNLHNQGIKKLVIDLRNNGGGYLRAATSIIDEFLPMGEMIVYTDGHNQDKNIIYSTNKTRYKDIEVTVLINEYSASASEIVAGAFQDNDRGIIVGRRSFGKGLVQEQYKFKDNSAVRLTVARYYTPSGRCIQKPYSKERSDYYHDLIDRYSNGEMLNQDSIHHNDSLKYETKSGRIVYGGGGITPDIFVAVDTNKNYLIINNFLRKAVMFNFAFEYVQDNKSKILSLYKTDDEFVESFSKESLNSDFIYFLSDNSVSYDEELYNEMKNDILLRIKANIARQLYNEKAYHKVILSGDNLFTEAINTNYF